MKTSYRKTNEGLVIDLEGFLDFESQADLRKKLEAMTEKSSSEKELIIFNLRNLEFVGSSGISHFISTLKQFHASCPTEPRYCNVGTEFRKLMNAMDDDGIFEFYEDEASALRRPRFDS
jgi:anti-anti-sigma factor